MSEQRRSTMEKPQFRHPADLADELESLSPEEAAQALIQLPPETAAQTLGELDPQAAQAILKFVEESKLREYLHYLPPNVAADLLGFLDEEKRQRILASLTREESRRIQNLLVYPPDTAGGIMSDQFIKLRANQTVQEVLEELRFRPRPTESDISYLYVVDEQDRLVGVVPLRTLVFAQPEERIQDIMVREVYTLSVHDDREKVAQQFEHYHFLALPVLDDEGRLVGIVKATDALEVAKDEATEDMQLMVGLSGEEKTWTPWPISIKLRLPWLLFNLLTAFLAGWVVSLFEGTIARWTALTAFLPIIAGQGGNAGTQTLTIIVRDLATGDLDLSQGLRALTKELLVGTLNGLVIGSVVGMAGYLWRGDWILGIVAGAAMVLNMIAAAIAGVAVPLGLKLLRQDPALASSIFLTTVTDVCGFFSLLSLATIALHYLLR